jgi:hypothetical protein
MGMALNLARKANTPIMSTTSPLPEPTVIPKLAISAFALFVFVVSPADTTGEATGGTAVKDNKKGSDDAPPRHASP